MNDIVQWLVRKKEGEVEGPLTTVEVVRRIRSGHYLGEEFVSTYPSGRWHPISYEENFFNILLEVLETELFDEKTHSAQEREEVTERLQTIKKAFKQGQEREQTQGFLEKPGMGRAVFEDVEAKTPIIIQMEKKKSHQKKSSPKQAQPNSPKNLNPKPPQRDSPPENLSSSQEKRKPFHQASYFQLLIFTGVFLIIMVLFFFLPLRRDQQGQGIHLLRPQFGKGQRNSRKQLQVKMARGIRAFSKDSFENYLVAQDRFVDIVQSSTSISAFGFLCMTYRELWPLSQQDAQDHRTLDIVLRRVQKLNPKSPSANTCLVVSHWIRGEYDDALRIMNTALVDSPSLLFFNHMVGDIYSDRQDYRSAAYYFAKVRELWSPPPVWSKSILQEARVYRKQKMSGEAIKLYHGLLKQNPDHGVAKIELGILEFDPNQNLSKARDYIASGLASKQFIPKMIEAEAFLTLAKISVLLGSNREALSHAQKAFALDSSNEEARSLIVRLGGIKALNSVAMENMNMVSLGEQYMKMDKYTAAQAEFRGAFEANPKNGFAALRAGEALWAMGQHKEAIDWVKKSIKADPEFLRGYLILSDFQSSRFDYINAIETLKGALRVNPNHHGIFRGFALIELRRRYYEGAVRFAKKALDLYDTDIPSLVILAKALTRKGEPEEAFQYLRRALELDSSHEEVQIAFSSLLAALQGTDSGIDHLDGLISKYGKVVYMRAIGELLTREERYKEAITYYYDALEKNPKDKKILIALGKVLEKERRYEEARDIFLDAAVLDPSDGEPIFLIGQLYLNSGRNNLAKKEFRKVIQLNPHYPMIHYFAGLAHLKLGDYDSAIKMAQQERLVNPDIPESFMLAGEAYFFKKEYNACAEQYQQVLSKGHTAGETYIKLARCYRLAGNLDSAMTMLSLAEQKESGNSDIYKELGALYHSRGSYIKSISAYNRYLQLSPNAGDRTKIEALIKEADRLGDGNE